MSTVLCDKGMNLQLSNLLFITVSAYHLGMFRIKTDDKTN